MVAGSAMLFALAAPLALRSAGRRAPWRRLRAAGFSRRPRPPARRPARAALRLRARTSCWIRPWRPAISRSPSALAAFLASSIICAARFSACAMISAARARASPISSSALLPRRLERLLALLGRRQAVGDLFLARLDGAHQRRPDELDREPDEQPRRRDRLRDQREIDVHAVAPAGDSAGRYLMTASSGLPNANNIARPTPMMNEASIRPSSRNTLACSCGSARAGAPRPRESGCT